MKLHQCSGHYVWPSDLVFCQLQANTSECAAIASAGLSLSYLCPDPAIHQAFQARETFLAMSQSVSTVGYTLDFLAFGSSTSPPSRLLLVLLSVGVGADKDVDAGRFLFLSAL